MRKSKVKDIKFLLMEMERYISHASKLVGEATKSAELIAKVLVPKSSNKLKRLTKDEIIALYHGPYDRIAYGNRCSPRFKIGDLARMREDAGEIRVKRSWNSGHGWEPVQRSWSYIDDVREPHRGKVGVVVKIEEAIITDPPTDPFGYYVQFPNYANPINMLGEWLEEVVR